MTDSRLRAAFEAIFRKALTLEDANPSEKVTYSFNSCLSIQMEKKVF